MGWAQKILTGLLLGAGVLVILLLGLIDLTPYLRPPVPSAGDPSQAVRTTRLDPAKAPEAQVPPLSQETPRTPDAPLPLKESPAATGSKADTPNTPPEPPPPEEDTTETPRPPGTAAPDEPAAAVTLDGGEEGLYPWSVLLASFKAQDRAERAIEIYRAKGIEAYWVKVALEEKGTWFRVFAGHFRSREDADAFLKEKGVKGGRAKSTRFASLVGVFSAKEDAGPLADRLRAQGTCPYVIDVARRGAPHVCGGLLHGGGGRGAVQGVEESRDRLPGRQAVRSVVSSRCGASACNRME